MVDEIIDYLNLEYGLVGVIGYFLIIVLFIPIIIKTISNFFEIHIFSNLISKKKYKLWISILRLNDSINQCIKEYDELKESSLGLKKFLFFYIGLIIGFILPVAISVLIYIIIGTLFIYKIQIEFIGLYSFALSNLLISLVLIKTNFKFREDIKSLDNKISRFEKIDYVYALLISFSISFVIYVLIILYLSIIDLTSMSNPSEVHFKLVILINSFNSLFALLILSSFIKDRNYFLFQIEVIINRAHSKQFPYLCITTIGGAQIKGKLKDAFNSTYITLVEKGYKKTTLWSSIDSLELISDEAE